MTDPTALLDCFAIVAPGLEALALAEALALGLPAGPEEGGIAWRGDASSVLRANMGLRIASRVLVRLASFEARSFAELEKFARRIPWGQVLAPGDAVRFRVTCKKSRLYHSDAVAQRVADAAQRTVRGLRAEGSSVSDDEEFDVAETSLVIVRFFHDRCTVSADTSGALLHRRGYRQATAKAPLRETIAAALLAASGWDGVAPLIDPLCGSGTIPIEAALISAGIAPGARRRFAIERWPGIGAEVVACARGQITADLATSRVGAPARILGTDRDAGAVVSARANAERAGVESSIEFLERTISELVVPEGPPGWIVTNPPYGVRVGDATRVRDLWAQLGNVLRERAVGWQVALLSPEPALDRQLKLVLRAVAATTNGGIPIRLMHGTVLES